MSEPLRAKKCPVDLQNFKGSEREKKQQENLLTDFSHVFSKDESDEGFTDKMKREIQLTDKVSIKLSYIGIPLAVYHDVQDYLESLLEKLSFPPTHPTPPL